MAWYAYCIGEKQAFPELARHRKPVPMESVLGVSGNQVFLYPASDLAVIVSEHNPAETLNQKSGVDHARVIADCFQHSTVLPFRFGTVFNDDETLRKSIRSNQRQFLGNIDKLRGKTEMHLKIFVDDCCGKDIEQASACRGRGPRVSHQPARECRPHPGAADPRARGQLPDAPAVHAARRGGQLPAHRKRQDGAGHCPPDRPQMRGALPEQVLDNQRQMRECQMQVSGPWPPYHFVHRLTRPAHAQPAAAAPLPLAVPVGAQAVTMPEAVPALA